MAENWKYQVALSFAGEQRDYVEQVSNALDKMGSSTSMIMISEVLCGERISHNA